MEVIESESSVLKKDQLIVLYCIEEVERNYVFNTANSFALKLEERRMVLLYDINDEAERHQQMPYPLCVKVLFYLAAISLYVLLLLYKLIKILNICNVS